ncbi:signal recognition particle-docking protein FtsY [Paraburkholderia sp. SARCC-3016]|uniref:signal recognition particle-docking protein FtsY n=1 Tax=Paraburkholderia sp. SARCC-3016 TaxID=3058611 RepID=UPI00280660C5|nr:signal recognition particle-docking protein FtsY [Paraburkholderia sp. SARCC-3016]MDQ7981191.1 signal recognition particle-docking protein FtsY [Paraburkholderia sp. SARCC-3016]
MFSFLKRFRGSKASDNAPAESPDAADAATPDVPADAAPVTETPLQPAIEARADVAQAPAQAAQPVQPAPQPVRSIAPQAAPAPVASTQAFAPASAEPVAPPRAEPQRTEPPRTQTQPHTSQNPQAQPQTEPQPRAPFQPAPPVAREPERPAIGPAAMARAPEAPAVSESSDISTAYETVEIVPPPAPEPAAKRSWLTRLKSGLSKTSSSITGIFVGAKIDEELYEELETALLMSDAGVDATEYLLETLREKVRAERLTDPQQVKAALRELLVGLLKPLEKSLMLGRAQPLVMMIAGVNGAGKTTSIGKLAKHLQRFDQSVLLAAGDTFRAAAREQLAIWGERNNVTVVSQESGDPAAVIFDAVGAARARKIDVLMADTAGRLPTQLHLMEELRKVKRVIGKALDGAPHEVLLVIDANTGQNALAQVKAFDDALGLTGLIVTKLDGTAKGGILAAIARQRPVPVYFIGIGEKVEDLQPFSAEEFSDALLGS